MELPIELFLGGMGISIALAIFGFLRQPQIPAMLCFGGMFMLVFAVATDTIILGTNAVSGNPDLVHYEVTSPAVSVTANVITPIRAEYPSSSSSQLVGDTFDCMSVPLAKSGAPVAGTLVRAGVFGNTGNMIKQFDGSLDVQNMAVGLTTYTFCLPEGETYKIGTFPNVERIGFEYNAGDAVNFITGRVDNANPYDGTVTVAQVFTTATGLWTTPSTANDLNMKLWLRGDFAENLESTYEFTELPKTLFALMGSIFMLCGALMVLRNN